MEKISLDKREVHTKEWGEEIWLVNAEYCGKLLRLKKEHHCSYHMHKNKDETFYVTKGKVIMEVGDKSMIMLPGDTVRIIPTTYHRFTGLIDSEIIEFSTHHEESDSYRMDGQLSGRWNDHEFSNLEDKTIPK